MKNKRINLILFLLLLTFLTIACRLNIGGPKPDQELNVSPDFANQMEEDLNSSTENVAEGNPVELTFTQDQLTSYLLYEVDTSVYGITNPQVYLEEDQIIVYGQVEHDFITADAKIILRPYIDSGIPRMDVVSVDLGPIPAPDTLLNSLSDTIDQTLLQTLAEIPEGYQITSVVIANGSMTITAQK